MSEEKTQVADINTSRYDFKYEESDKDLYKVDKGLDEELVLRISEEKKDPEWVKELRLKSLKIFNGLKDPDWGPDISDLDVQ